MRKRYDLTRSDNYPLSDTVSYVCSGDGELTVVTGFPVKSATVSFATLPIALENDVASSSSSSSEAVSSELPRLFVSAYTATGFTVSYENIPASVGFIEFNYVAS